jgi:hypothetical protein
MGMLFELWNTITDYLKDKPYWQTIKGLFTLLSLYLTGSVLAYEYLRWQYGLEPPLALFLRSYLFKQISLIALTVCVIGLLFRVADRRRATTTDTEVAWTASLRKYGSVFGQRVALIGLVLCLAVPAFNSLAPRKASNIRILFLEDPDPEFNREALVYLLYELNQRQRQWYFKVDFDVFNKRALTSSERNTCEGEREALCFAEKAGSGQQLIAITTNSLGDDHFWVNHGSTSVITTVDWKPYIPPTQYEYLVYSVLTQSIVLHLNTQCSGLPAAAFRESREGFGDLFEFSPRRYAMKPAILAAHLSPGQEETLMNCFGAEYLKTTSSLLSLEWLRSEAVKKNLERSFQVSLDAQKPSEAK